MVQIEFLKQLWRNCVKQSRSEDVLDTASGESKMIAIAAFPDRLPSRKVEYKENDLLSMSFEEKLQANLIKWAQTSNITFNIDEQQFYQDIYAIFSNIALKPEVVESAIERFIASEKANPVNLFRKLSDFYNRWCDGEFVDAAPENNLPQKQMLQLRSHNINIGLRKVDINTGLNVMILLLELHRFREQSHKIKAEFTFYPSGKPDSDNFFTSKLLRVINYSDSVEIGNFSNVVGAFLQGALLESVYLGDANLTGANLSSAKLAGAYLGDANLTGVQAKKANLADANLGDANLSGALLREANLTHCDLTHCNLSGADLSGADLSGADLSYANLAGVNLAGVNLAGANLTSANLRDAELSGANLKNSIVFGANLSDANLIGVDLSYADLCRADLSGVNLRGSTLKGTNLSDSLMFGTNFTEAILLAADLSYAKLNGANLNNANLQGAIILGADLGGVDLSKVILARADLSGVTLSEADLSGADLSDAILLGTDLSYTNLQSANLSGSNLTGAIFYGADLSHTNLSYAILGGADLSEANLENSSWNENLEWENVRGLDKALNVPQALKDKFRL